MFDKMKQLMEMKKQADRIKRELDAESIESEKVKGIRIVINGAQQLRSIEIDESFLGADNKQKLEKDILSGVNAALEESQKVSAQKMKAMMPAGFPGM